MKALGNTHSGREHEKLWNEGTDVLNWVFLRAEQTLSITRPGGREATAEYIGMESQEEINIILVLIPQEPIFKD